MRGFKRAFIAFGLIAALVSGFLCHAQATEKRKHLLVKAGFGRVQIREMGFVLSRDFKGQLETTLLIDGKFASVVLADRATHLYVPLESLNPHSLTLDEWVSLIQKQLTVQYSPPDEEDQELLPPSPDPVDPLAEFLKWQWKDQYGFWTQSPWFQFLSWWAHWFLILWLISAFLFGYAGAKIAPGFTLEIDQFLMKAPIESLAFGMLTNVLILPVTLVMAFSIVAWPAIPLLWSLVFIFSLMGVSHVAFWMMQKIFRRLDHGKRWIVTFLGLIAIYLLALIPQVGWMISWLIATLGMGAVIRVFSTKLFQKRGT